MEMITVFVTKATSAHLCIGVSRRPSALDRNNVCTSFFGQALGFQWSGKDNQHCCIRARIPIPLTVLQHDSLRVVRPQSPPARRGGSSG
ncbi:hypothetical protein ElyMa_004711100 [Elysia marginata]|uniref:Uncharacterized protein n=1 Tax=Elysia marginata TaxID=1093978 RepID=A0AAV4I8D4_9GAST|nr:hypothetical protein ElyMa_004711100 [Elysia marginata]